MKKSKVIKFLHHLPSPQTGTTGAAGSACLLSVQFWKQHKCPTRNKHSKQDAVHRDAPFGQVRSTPPPLIWESLDTNRTMGAGINTILVSIKILASINYENKIIKIKWLCRIPLRNEALVFVLRNKFSAPLSFTAVCFRPPPQTPSQAAPCLVQLQPRWRKKSVWSTIKVKLIQRFGRHFGFKGSDE